MKVVLNFLCVSFVNVFTFLIEWKREKVPTKQCLNLKWVARIFKCLSFCSLLVRRTLSTFTVCLSLAVQVILMVRPFI
jgi:hypothetical protein